MPGIDMQNHEIISIIILVVSCTLLLCGFSARQTVIGPWVMLLGICSTLGIIAYNILRHTASMPF